INRAREYSENQAWSAFIPSRPTTTMYPSIPQEGKLTEPKENSVQTLV
ncbi:unnamed protein product, partial [Heterotrigona itama]